MVHKIMETMETIETNEVPRLTYPLKRISWSAILVGALVGVGLSFLLNLFMVAIGLSAVNVGPDGATSLAVGGVLGLIIGSIVAMGAAGYTAGYLGHTYCPRRNLGILYGFATWSMALLLSALAAGQIDHHAANYSRAILGKTVVATPYHGDNGVNNNVVVRTNERNTNNTTTDTKVVTSTDTLAAGAFLLFLIFSIGAISTCVGAYMAMSCDEDDVLR